MLLSSQIIIFLLVVAIIWLVALSVIILKAYNIYRTLTADLDQKNVAEVLAQIKKQQHTNQDDLKQITTALTAVNHKLKTHIQKLGFIRYNPFGNTGGDQSFCLCLLDEGDNGIMITSLHTRDQTRLYSKAILAGHNQENVPLSKEETACIKQAQKWSKHE